jgi:hypothetical protein
MLELSNPALLWAKQKLVKTSTGVQNKSITGIEVKQGKEVVVVYRFTAGEFLAGEERTQLLKILGACKLKEEDVVLINVAQVQNVSLSWLRSNFPIKTLLVFGDIEISKNFQLKKYFTYNIDGLQIVKGEPIAKLLTSGADKKALWEELKRVFGV